MCQKDLDLLKRLKMKQQELQKLESELAAQVLEDLRNGAEVEAGPLRAKVSTRQRGRKREQRLVIY